ncbi:MAG: Uma2 family endonuclease [Eubacterium sp.]|nr:Uma2 family endonuclease [Eubacterium sp.]
MPDGTIICRDNNEHIPVIVIEILSAYTWKNDYSIKMKKYAELGIKEYWIISWEFSALNIYFMNDENNKYELYDSYTLWETDDCGNEIKVDKSFSPVLFPELVVDLHKVFDLF